MGIGTCRNSPHKFLDCGNLSNSMSQDYHQGAFSFSNVFDRSQQQQQHVAQQIRRDKMRIQGFDPQPLLGITEEDSGGNNNIPVYETAGMLSEMFNFPSSGGNGPTTATELLESQISQSYRNQRAPPPADWFSHRNMGTDPAAAMQLFLMNPQQQRSPSPSPSNNQPPNNSTSSTLHMLLPNPSSTTFHGAPTSFGQYGWVQNSGNVENAPTELPGVVEGQGLSLSLSSSLQHLEAANAEELRMGEGAMMFFGQGGGSTQQQYQFKNLAGGGGGLHLQGGVGGSHQLQVGSSYGTVNMLRNSKYAKAAQELLEEFCSVGRGQFNRTKSGRQNNNNGGDDGGAGGGNSKDVPPLSASDRLEHQRRKVKLLSMLDEVDRRYNHYCEQMQMVVNSFDMVMGFGSAVPYTTLAQKAMSRHFRCLKDAIASQLKNSCEMLGEKDVGTSGVTKGETPRLRILEQSLRQQRAFNQMGLMEQEAWRPQRGLPERSVNILRAWLFEHFLHPYPSDADKHLLARQTGLSRNQVSNWFINARVRLWKPMVEEMYQQEAKDEPTDDQEPLDHSGSSAQTPTPHHQHDPTTSSVITPLPAGIDNDPSFPATMMMHDDDDTSRNRDADMESTLMRFGANAGDVSLTLGLRHAGNMPEKSSHFRDFGGC